MWSFACMMFEMATGDFLFEPRKGKNYGKDDDHLAQMMELLGRMPRNMALGGRLNKRFFDNTGHLRRIRGLTYWPLKKVLSEKYRFKELEAGAFADFLLQMLVWDPDRRQSAQRMLEHPWLKMTANYEYKMSDEEF
jgi:serine/threonine-protein kinase SRPK3